MIGITTTIQKTRILNVSSEFIVAKPKTIIDEVTKNGEKFGRKFIYIAMVKVIAPVLLVVLLLQALGVF